MSDVRTREVDNHTEKAKPNKFQQDVYNEMPAKPNQKPQDGAGENGKGISGSEGNENHPEPKQPPELPGAEIDQTPPPVQDQPGDSSEMERGQKCERERKEWEKEKPDGSYERGSREVIKCKPEDTHEGGGSQGGTGGSDDPSKQDDNAEQSIKSGARGIDFGRAGNPYFGGPR